jgi:hypothetical protein
MEGVKVKCRFTVEYELEVQVEEGECPIEKLSGKDIFTTFGILRSERSHVGSVFGLDEYCCRENGIKVLNEDCYGDPSPTGRGRFVRDWEIDEGGE